MKNLQDTKKVLKARGFAAGVGFGERPAILIIDLIRALPKRGPPWRLISTPARGCREDSRDGPQSGSADIFTTVEYDPSLKDAGLFVRKVSGLKWLVTGSRWVELHPALKRRKGELLIKKKYASAFFGTDLASLLSAAEWIP